MVRDGRQRRWQIDAPEARRGGSSAGFGYRDDRRECERRIESELDLPAGRRAVAGRPAQPMADELDNRAVDGGLRHDAVEVHPSSQEVTHVDPALSELPVELEVELARLPLSLAELGALQPRTADRPMTLRYH